MWIESSFVSYRAFICSYKIKKFGALLEAAFQAGSKGNFREWGCLHLGITPGRKLLEILASPGTSCPWSWTQWGVWDEWSTVIRFRGSLPNSATLVAFSVITSLLRPVPSTSRWPRKVGSGEVKNGLCWWFIKACGFWLLYKTPHQRVRLGSCWALSSFVVGIGLCFLPFAFDSVLSCCSLSCSI